MERVIRPVATCVLAISAQAALAQSPAAQDNAPTFDSLDADQSAFLSRREAQSHVDVAARFTVADRNRDGMLSRAEFEAAFARTPGRPVKPEQPRPPRP